MTIIEKKNDDYRVWVNGRFNYCTLDEVLYLLSIPEEETSWLYSFIQKLKAVKKEND